MIHEIALKRDANTINLARLHDELTAQLTGVIGVSTGDYGVRVHLDHKPTAGEIATVEGIVKAHDPTQLTKEQQALVQWKTKVEALSAKDWSALTPTEREEALRLQHEQMIYQATGKLPSVATPK